MKPFPREDDTTPPEVREMVDRTLDLIHAQVGSLRARRRPIPTENVLHRLEVIRRRALMDKRGT